MIAKTYQLTILGLSSGTEIMFHEVTMENTIRITAGELRNFYTALLAKLDFDAARMPEGGHCQRSYWHHPTIRPPLLFLTGSRPVS